VCRQFIRNIVAILILNIEVAFIVFQYLLNRAFNALLTYINITCHFTFIFITFFFLMRVIVL